MKEYKKKIQAEVNIFVRRCKTEDYDLVIADYYRVYHNYFEKNDVMIELLQMLADQTGETDDELYSMDDFRYIKAKCQKPIQFDSILNSLEGFNFISFDNTKSRSHQRFKITNKGIWKLEQYKITKKLFPKRRKREMFSPLFFYDKFSPIYDNNTGEKIPPITVFVDHREYGFASNFWNSYVARLYRTLNLDYQLRSLAIGDYCFQTTINGIDYYYPLIIERKTIFDLAKSGVIDEGTGNSRLSRQASFLFLLKREIPIEVVYLYEGNVGNAIKRISEPDTCSSAEQIFSIKKEIDNFFCSDHTINEIDIILRLKQRVEAFRDYKGNLIKKEIFDAAVTKVFNFLKLRRSKHDSLEEEDEKYKRSDSVELKNLEKDDIFEGKDENFVEIDQEDDDDETMSMSGEDDEKTMSMQDRDKTLSMHHDEDKTLPMDQDKTLPMEVPRMNEDKTLPMNDDEMTQDMEMHVDNQKTLEYVPPTFLGDKTQKQIFEGINDGEDDDDSEQTLESKFDPEQTLESNYGRRSRQEKDDDEDLNDCNDIISDDEDDEDLTVQIYNDEKPTEGTETHSFNPNVLEDHDVFMDEG